MVSLSKEPIQQQVENKHERYWTYSYHQSNPVAERRIGIMSPTKECGQTTLSAQLKTTQQTVPVAAA
jgi:hypothetical protein